MAIAISGLFESKPKRARKRGAREKKRVDPAIRLARNQVARRAVRLPRLMPWNRSPLKFFDDFVGDDLIDSRTRHDREPTLSENV